MNNIYQAEKDNNLFLLLQQANSEMDAFCGGRHTCGKCRIKLLSGYLPPNEIEKEKLSEEELKQGIRLACTHSKCEEKCSFEVVNQGSQFSICGATQIAYGTLNEVGYAIGVDIGTTTLVMELINLKTGKIEKENTFINPQKIYGADVISRIDAAQKKGVDVLQKVLLEKMENVISNYGNKKLVRMCVCGNATMTHLFMGENTSSIATAPYTCKINTYQIIASKKLFPNIKQSFVIQVLPPISAYVGSDIVMDIYACKQTQYKNSLLIDLGTNGEISLFANEKLSVSSAACGPAFEGGNMRCGCGAIDGAADTFTYENGWHYTTINHKKLSGICGSGYMSLLSTALTYNMIDESGYLETDIQINEHINLTQKDIREFQMAKSAIASACVCLCNEQQLRFKDIECLFVAGGFGTHIKMEHLVILGIIPKELLSRIKVIGNSAIQGVCHYAIHQDLNVIEEIMNKSHSLLLANNAEFTEEFMKNMMFKEQHES